MMIQCAQASRDRGINPVFIYGLFGSASCTRCMTWDSSEACSWSAFGVAGIPSLAVVALVAVYLLGMMHSSSVRAGWRRVLGFDERDTSIELVALRPAGDDAARAVRPHQG